MSPWADYLTRKWGLFPIHAPAESSPFAIGGDPGLEGPPYVFYLKTDLEAFLDQGLEYSQVPVIFDLCHSLEAQLQEAKDILTAMREYISEFGRQSGQFRIVRAPQLQNDKYYKTYLRLLDADLSGASRHEMASLIYPHKPNEYPEFCGSVSVRKALSAAKKLRDGGYKALLGK